MHDYSQDKGQRGGEISIRSLTTFTRTSISYFLPLSLLCVHHTFEWQNIVQLLTTRQGFELKCVFYFFSPAVFLFHSLWSEFGLLLCCRWSSFLLRKCTLRRFSSQRSLSLFYSRLCLLSVHPASGVDSGQRQPAHLPRTCSMGLHWSPLTTLRRWPQRWDGVPVAVTINLSVRLSACSPVSLFLPNWKPLHQVRTITPWMLDSFSLP